MSAELLRIEDLHVSFSTRGGLVQAVRGVSLDVMAGATLGVVGESGSGKSVTAYAVTRLLDRAGRVTGGQILFRGRDITRASAGEMQGLRGDYIAMVFQNPRAALNPIRSIGRQLMDALAVGGEVVPEMLEVRAFAAGYELQWNVAEEVEVPHVLHEPDTLPVTDAW